MKWLDRVLIFTAGVSILSIIYLFSASQISSNYVQVKNLPKDGDVVVYNEEVEAALEKYFESIQSDPSIEEEEKRLFEENDTTEKNHPGEDIKNETSGKDIPPEKKESDVNPESPSKSEKEIAPGFRIVHHSVQNGESIWRIARKYGVSVATITSANPDKARKMIQPGDELDIPSQNGIFYPVKNGDTLGGIAKRYKIKSLAIKEANGLTSNAIHKNQKLFLPGAKEIPRKKTSWRSLFVMPLHGRITSGFGWRKSPFGGQRHFHTGIDIGGNPVGTRVRAATDGVVVYSGWGGQFGNMIILKHKNGYFSVYAHLSRIIAEKNKYVKRGAIIGNVGSTGLSTGPHLHFEIRHLGNHINPFIALKLKEKVYIKG